jgi:hypothetical protein
MSLRSDHIKTLIRDRAHGICEACNQPAPFLDLEGNPFLVEHHLMPLSEGGDDTEMNTAMICANCHNHIHNGLDGTAYNTQLTEKIHQKQQQIDATRNFVINVHAREQNEHMINRALDQARIDKESRRQQFDTEIARRLRKNKRV